MARAVNSVTRAKKSILVAEAESGFTVNAKNAQDPLFHLQRQADHRGDPLLANILRVLEIVFFLDLTDGVKGPIDDFLVDGALVDVDFPPGQIVLAQAVGGGKAQHPVLIVQQLDGAGLDAHDAGGAVVAASINS
jgi:hypothetical protein